MTNETQSIFTDLTSVLTASGHLVLRAKHPPSEEQQRVLEHAATSHRNLIVRATAGSGKSTLLEMLAEQLISSGHIAAGKRVLFLAFSVPIVNQLIAKLPEDVDVRSLNSLGQQITKENLADVSFDDKKYEKLINHVIQNRNYSARARKGMKAALEESVEISMNHLLPLGVDQSEWEATMREFDVRVDIAPDDLYSLTMEVIRQGMDFTEQGHISFLDQVYAPFHFGWTLKEPYQYIMIDEAQDVSKAKTSVMLAAANDETVITAVGDSAQAIFSFGGANPNSMTDLREILDADELPLSVTFRCPVSHVHLARNYTDKIDPAPGAIEGLIAEIDGATFISSVQPGDLVLCRTNAPLIKWAYRLIQTGRRATVSGKDLSKSLVKIARRAATWEGEEGPTPAKGGQDHGRTDNEDVMLDSADFQRRLKALYNHELRLANALKNQTEKELELAALKDRYHALNVIYRQHEQNSLQGLIKFIRTLFRSDKNSIVLSSVHRAKGLEADTVYILEPQLLPHPIASTETALAAERAIQFVAYTRSRKRLYFVDPPPPAAGTGGSPTPPNHAA